MPQRQATGPRCSYRFLLRASTGSGNWRIFVATLCWSVAMVVRWTGLAALTRRASPNYWDVIAFTMIVAVFVVIANGSRGMVAALPPPGATTVSLDYGNLPYYALRTVLRMFIALAFSFLFTFTYATLAAKSRRAEMVLIPILDVLQSVPVLGFLSFTVTVFTGAFPGSTLGPECAAIFAIFTSQAWNMAFSFYQSLRTVPRDLDEVTRGFRLTPWQRFWSLEVPFAIPGLLWNTMMSMSGGWFFVVASEAISVGNTTIKLPGSALTWHSPLKTDALTPSSRPSPPCLWSFSPMTNFSFVRWSRGRPSSASSSPRRKSSRSHGCCASFNAPADSASWHAPSADG